MDTKPTSPVLDAGHPLAANCVFAVILGTGDSNGLKDIINDTAPTNSGVTFTTGANGPRALFDDINDYLDYGASNAFLGDGTNGITVVIGLKKTDSTERDCQHFCVDSNTGNERFWGSIPFVNGSCYFDCFGTGSGRNFCASGTEGDDVWILVAGPSGKHMWKNGTDLSSALGSQVGTPTSAAFRIGKAANLGSAGGDLFELDYLIIYNTEVTDSGDIAAIFADPVEPFRPQIPVLSGNPTINSAASTLTVVWDQAVTDNAGTITLSGQRKTITVGAIQSGDGTATHVYPLTPAGKIFLSTLEAGSITVDIPAGKVSGATEDNEAITGQAVTNSSTVIYTTTGTHTYQIEADSLYSNEATATIGAESLGRGRARGRHRGRWF